MARAEALRADRLLLARQLIARLRAATSRLQLLDKRTTLYTQRLLPLATEQAAAALTAYDNDDGDFAGAVRSRIAELDAGIEALTLAVQRQQTIAGINYLLAGAAVPQPIARTEQ
jgi:hypothetical protein